MHCLSVVRGKYYLKATYCFTSQWQGNKHFLLSGQVTLFQPITMTCGKTGRKNEAKLQFPSKHFSQNWRGVDILILKSLTIRSGNRFSLPLHGQVEQKQQCCSQPHTAVTCQQVSKPPGRGTGRTDYAPSHSAASPKLPAELLGSVESRSL